MSKKWYFGSWGVGVLGRVFYFKNFFHGFLKELSRIKNAIFMINPQNNIKKFWIFSKHHIGLYGRKNVLGDCEVRLG